MGSAFDPCQIAGGRRSSRKRINATGQIFPFFGKITAVEWRGQGYGSGLIESLSGHHKLAELVWRECDFESRSHAGDFDGWTIQAKARWRPDDRDWQTLCELAARLRSITY